MAERTAAVAKHAYDVLTLEVQSFFAQVGNLRLKKPCRAHELRRVIQQVLDMQ